MAKSKKVIKDKAAPRKVALHVKTKPDHPAPQAEEAVIVPVLVDDPPALAVPVKLTRCILTRVDGWFCGTYLTVVPEAGQESAFDQVQSGQIADVQLVPPAEPPK